jgi:hypothetical protein
MLGNYLPRPDDFHPSLRRGHGTTHPEARTRDGVVTRQSYPCGHETCERSRESGKGDAHIDKAANVKDWQVEHKCAPVERQRRKR